MNRKFLSVLLTAIMIISCSIPAFAATPEPSTSTETTYFEDGSSLVVTTVTMQSETRAPVKEGSKTGEYRDANGKTAWTFTINGEFTYDGSSAKAITSSCSSSIKISGWTCTSKSARCSGASVIGNTTFSYDGKSQTINLTLTCSPTGSIK